MNETINGTLNKALFTCIYIMYTKPLKYTERLNNSKD